MGEHTRPDPFTPAQVEAWNVYLDDTKPAREVYDHKVREWTRMRDQAIDAANAQRDAIARAAWEQCEEAIANAWHEYTASTCRPRETREASLTFALPGELMT